MGICNNIVVPPASLYPRGRAVIEFSATAHKLKLDWLLNLANWCSTPAALLGPGMSVLGSWSVCVKPCSLVACRPRRVWQR